MEATKYIEQRIERQTNDRVELAFKYLSIVFSLNNIHITKRKLQLLAFISCKGIKSVNSRQEFCSTYKSSEATINNMISELYEAKLVEKEDGKVKIATALRMDFNSIDGISLNIILHAHR